MKRISAFLLLIFTPLAQAATLPNLTFETKRGVYLEQGLFIGGQQGRDLSLLALELKPARNQPVERITFKIGEADGQPLQNSAMPFFQVSLQKDLSRIVIDLSQVQRTRLDEKDILARIRRSRFISSADFTMDPEDLSTNVTLHLKKAVRLEVFRQSANGELILDLYAPAIGDSSKGKAGGA